MSRESKILKHIDKSGLGLEIGPSHNPIAPKREGFNVHIIDHLSREGLREKYTGHDVNLENIEEVDFIWQGEDYAELTGKQKFYDWIIASHVIEHTPDLIGFLNNCDAVLKDDGVISLAIPDKRYCFDHYRQVTGLASVIDSHLRKDKVHTSGNITDFYMNTVKRNGQVAWRAMSTGEYTLFCPPEMAREEIASAAESNAYTDVHAWCFVPHSFRLLIHDLYDLNFIPLQELDFYPTAGCEFHITLSRKGKGIDKTRLEMLAAIELEIKDDAEVRPKATEKIKNLTLHNAKALYKIFGQPFKPTLKRLRLKLQK